MNAMANGQNRQKLLALFVVCVVCVFIIDTAHRLTEEEIKQNQKQHTLKWVMEVMPLSYDNDLLDDYIEVIEPAFLGTNKPVTVYRARKKDAPIGLIFMPVVADGYSGTIELAIGISLDGQLTGVRVNRHQETQELGDGIDQRKTDWILGFDQHSIENTPAKAWAVKKEGGEFDQLSGATISPRAVINAVKSTLDYYSLNHKKLYQK